jgi:hypothetical protein
MSRHDSRDGNVRRRFALAAALAAISGCMSAQGFAQSTIVKPGLWEISVTTRVSEVRTVGNPVAGVSGQSTELPAEARQPVVAPDVTRTLSECLTVPVVGNWTALTKIDRDYGACQIKPVSRNARRYTATLSCVDGKATGKADFTAASTAFKGEVRVVAHEPSYDRTDTKVIQGRWLRANCDGKASQP